MTLDAQQDGFEDPSEEEDAAVVRPSSWAGALAQLPGFLQDSQLKVPLAAACAAREVSAALEEDLEVDRSSSSSGYFAPRERSSSAIVRFFVAEAISRTLFP